MCMAVKHSMDIVAAQGLTRASNVAVKLAPKGAVSTAQQLISSAAAVSTTP